MKTKADWEKVIADAQAEIKKLEKTPVSLEMLGLVFSFEREGGITHSLRIRNKQDSEEHTLDYSVFNRTNQKMISDFFQEVEKIAGGRDW